MSSSASRRALSPSGSTGTITPRNNGTSSAADAVPSPLPSHQQQGQGGGHHHKRHVSSTSITQAAQKIFRFSSPLIVFFVGNPESAQGGGTPTSPGGLEPPMTQPEIEIVIKKMEKELHEVDASSLIMGSGGSLPGASVPLSFAKASTLYHHGGGALHVFLVYVPRRKSGGSSLAAARMKKAAALAKEWRDELFRTGATDSNLLIFFVHTDLIEAGQRATSTSSSNATTSETNHNGQRSGSTDDAGSTATVLKSAASFFSRIGNSSTKSAVEEALESVQEYMDDFQKRIPNAPRMCVFHPSSYNARMLDLLKESYHEQALRLKAVRHQSHMSRSAPGWSLQEFWRKGFDLAVHHMRFGAMHEAISSFSAMFTEYFNHSDDFGFVSDWSFLRDVGQVANVLDPQRTSIKGAPTVMMRLGYPSSLSDSAEVIDGLLYIVGAEMTCALFLGNREGALARFVSFYEVVKEKFNECNRADAVIVQQGRQQQMEAYRNAAAAASGGGGHSRMSSVSATTLSSAVHSASSSFDYSFSSFAAPQHGGDSGGGVFGVGHHANGTKRAAPPMYLQQFFSFRVVMSALDLCTGSNLAARVGSLVQERTGGGFMGIDGNTANASLQALGLPATASPVVAGGTPLRREVTTTFEGNDNEGAAARNRNSRQQPQQKQAAASGGGVITNGGVTADDSDDIDQFEYSIQSIDVNNFGWSATDDERVAQRQQLQAQQQQQLKDSSASTARSVSTRAQSHPSTAQREYERYCVVVGELCLCAREHLVALGDVCGFADPSEVSHLALTQLGHRTHSFSSLVSAATTAVGGGGAATAPATPFMASGGGVVTIVDTTKFCVEDDRRRGGAQSPTPTHAPFSSAHTTELRKWLGLECIRTQPRFHATYLSLTRVAASALRKGRRSKQSHSLMAQEAAALVTIRPSQAVDVLFRIIIPYYENSGWDGLMRHAEGLLVEGVRRILDQQQEGGGDADDAHDSMKPPRSGPSFSSPQSTAHPQQQTQQQKIPSPWFRAALRYALDRAMSHSSHSDGRLLWCSVFHTLQETHDARYGRRSSSQRRSMMMRRKSSVSVPAAAVALSEGVGCTPPLGKIRGARIVDGRLVDGEDDIEELIETVSEVSSGALDLDDDDGEEDVVLAPLSLSYVLHRRAMLTNTAATTASPTSKGWGASRGNIGNRGSGSGRGTGVSQYNIDGGYNHQQHGIVNISSVQADVALALGTLVTDTISISCVKKSTPTRILHSLHRASEQQRQQSALMSSTTADGGGGKGLTKKQSSMKLRGRSHSVAVDTAAIGGLEAYNQASVSFTESESSAAATAAAPEPATTTGVSTTKPPPLVGQDDATDPAAFPKLQPWKLQQPSVSSDNPLASHSVTTPTTTSPTTTTTTTPSSRTIGAMNDSHSLVSLPIPKWLSQQSQQSQHVSHFSVGGAGRVGSILGPHHGTNAAFGDGAAAHHAPEVLLDEPIHIVVMVSCAMDLKDQLGLTAEQCFGSVVLHSKKLWSVDSEPVHVIELNGIEPHYDPLLHAITLIVPFTPCHAGSYRVASFRLDVGALPLLQHYHGAAPSAATGVNSPLSSSTSGMDLSANRKSVTTVTPSGINNIVNHHDAALRCTLFVTPEPDAGIELSVTRPPPIEHCFGDSIQTFELGIRVAEPLRAVPPAPPSAFSTPHHSDVPDLALADTPVDYASPTSTLLRVSSKDCGLLVEAQIPKTSLCFFEGGSVDGMAALQSSLDKKVSQFQFVTPQRARGNSSGADARLARDVSMRRASSEEPPKGQYADIEPLAQVRVGKPPVRRNDRYQHPHHGRRTSGRLARPPQRMSPSEQHQGNLSMPRDGADLSGTLNGGALNGSFANYHKNGPMGGSLTEYPNALDGTIGRDGTGGGGVTFLIEAENNNTNGVNASAAPPPMPRSLQHPMFASLSASLRACLAEMAPSLDRVTVFQNTLASPVAARLLSNQSMSSPASPDLDASMSPQRTLNSSDLGTTAQPPSGSVETPQKEHYHNKDAEESNAHKDLRYQRGMSATIVANEYSTKLMRQATATSNVEGELLHVDGHTYEPTGFTTLNLFIPPPAHSETTTPLSKKSACSSAGTSLAATKLSLTIPMFPTHMKAEKVPLTFACRRSREISLRHTSLDSTFRQAFEVHYTFTPFQERVFATATVTNMLPLPPGSKGLWIRHAVLDVFPAEISETSRGYYVHSTMPANTRLFHAPIGYGDSVALTFELRLLPSYRCLQEVVRHGVRLCLAYSLYDTYHEEGVVPLPLRKLTPSVVASNNNDAMRSPSTSALFMSEEERALQEDWSVYNGLESLKQLHETTSCNILFATADHFTSKHLCVFSVMMFLSGADDDAREGGDEDSDEDDDDALLANARGISNYPSNYSDNGSMEDDAEEFNDDGTFRRKRSSRRSVNNNPRQSMQQQNHTLHAATNARGMHDVGEPVHFVAVIHAQANNWPTDCDPEGARFLVSLEVSPIEWMVVGRMRHVRVLSQSGEHQIRFSAVPVGSGAAVSFPTLSIRRIEEEGLLGGGDLAEGDPLAVDVVKARASLRLRRPTPNITLRNEPV